VSISIFIVKEQGGGTRCPLTGVRAPQRRELVQVERLGDVFVAAGIECGTTP